MMFVFSSVVNKLLSLIGLLNGLSDTFPNFLLQRGYGEKTVKPSCSFFITKANENLFGDLRHFYRKHYCTTLVRHSHPLYKKRGCLCDIS